VSFLGTLEQFNLTHVLQRLETHEKSGLLVVKQEEQWAEFYFQQGRLLCIGPARTNATLEDRLVQAGVISPQAHQEALRASDTAEPNETRMAMLLLESGFVSREELRAWASKETAQVLQQILTWSRGEIYFEEVVPPPTGRLLVALSIASLLTSIASQAPAPQPARSRITTVLVKDEPVPSSVSSTTPPVRASELLSDSIPTPRTTSELLSLDTPEPASNDHLPVSASHAIKATIGSPRAVAIPNLPRRIDTSFMKPEMVIMPTDLSSLRQQNPQFQLTPEQWQLFTLIDGHTSLQMACQATGAQPAQICQVVGELIASGLVYLLPPTPPVHASSPSAKSPVTAVLNKGQAAPTYAAQPRGGFVPMPTTDALPYTTPTPPAPGYGQRYYSQPVPVVQSRGPVAVNGGYARAGRGR
jgi:hypothetical protein